MLTSTNNLPPLELARDGVSSSIGRFFSKAWEITKIALKIIAWISFFAINPMMFSIAFVVGAAFNEKMFEATQKIIDIWEKQTWAICLITAAGAFLALPVTLATISVVSALRLGSYLSTEAQKE